MSTPNQKNSGILSIVPGALYGCRRTHDNGVALEPSKVRFARRVQAIAALWKGNAGQGAYASRAVANTAHGIQFPLNHLHDQMRSAIARGVPLERVEAMGYAVLEEARALHREKRRLKPAA